MRKTLFTIFFCLTASSGMMGSQAAKDISSTPSKHINKVMLMDGQDNDERIGMDVIHGRWTLEARIKGDGKTWKKFVTLIGGGEYTSNNRLDSAALAISDGHLYTQGVHLAASGVLPVDRWVHVAATCDGIRTRLYQDGRLVGETVGAFDILPGTIGCDEQAAHTLSGSIDEVRIWTDCLDGATVERWANRKVTPQHPFFSHLTGYYDFDDMEEDMALNRVGHGRLSYHMRNGRLKQYGTLPLASAVASDDRTFVDHQGSQTLLNAVTIESEWDVEQGQTGEQVAKLRLIADGTARPLRLQQMTLDLSGSTDLADITRVHIYYTGPRPRTQRMTELFGTGLAPARRMTFRARSAREEKVLEAGANYFLVTFDVKENAGTGHVLRAEIPSIKLSGKAVRPDADMTELPKVIVPSHKNQPNLLSMVQWNIWHGGVHLGKEGRQRIVSLLRASHADLITMQESYGAQQMIADSLGFHLCTRNPKDNLAAYSRFPIERGKTAHGFNSNPVTLTLPSGRQMMVNACWLRYAYRPEYTSFFRMSGLDEAPWVHEDSILALVDVTKLYTEDMQPNLSPDMPCIIAGDFNSFSHLDWTARAASIHFGYGAIPFPASLYLIGQGFKDTFREMNPDEVKRGEGTFAAIYGHLQVGRIDFIYYKGKDIRAIDAKIIRTMPDIDDVWPSDHAAVYTLFDLSPEKQH